MINETLFWQAMGEAALGMLLMFIALAGLLYLWARSRNQ